MIIYLLCSYYILRFSPPFCRYTQCSAEWPLWVFKWLCNRMQVIQSNLQMANRAILSSRSHSQWLWKARSSEPASLLSFHGTLAGTVVLGLSWSDGDSCVLLWSGGKNLCLSPLLITITHCLTLWPTTSIAILESQVSASPSIFRTWSHTSPSKGQHSTLLSSPWAARTTFRETSASN